VAETPGATSVIEHELRIAAQPEVVFEFFTDPAKMVRWMGVEATLDPRPGGVCRIRTNDEGVMLGKFLQVDPPWRLVFTMGWEKEVLLLAPESTAIEVSLTPDGDGTILRFTHTKLPPVVAEPHRVGWKHYLDRLAVAATGGDPGPDPWLDVVEARRAMLEAAGLPH
jgi:uncharacterized protein YndB with AHSA1/START domain